MPKDSPFLRLQTDTHFRGQTALPFGGVYRLYPFFAAVATIVCQPESPHTHGQISWPRRGTLDHSYFKYSLQCQNFWFARTNSAP